MITVDAPGFGLLEISHLVLDVNGTIAVDGVLVEGVAERIETLSKELYIHAITADTRGSAAQLLDELPIEVVFLPEGMDEDKAKHSFVQTIGADFCCSIGNGHNDRMMLSASALGFSVLQEEGGFAQTLAASDVICPSINIALDLLIHTDRLIATLRV